MKADNCLLCTGSELEVLEQVKTPDLIALYQKKFGINPAEEFKDHRFVSLNHCKSCDLKFFYPLLPGSDKFYEQLQRFDWYYVKDKEEYHIAQSYIKPGSKVLDVGCGVGSFKRHLEKCDFTGLELNQKAIEAGRKNGVNILGEFVEDHVKHNKESYDVVTSFQVLEHISSIRSFIESCKDAVKPGGILIFSVPSDDAFISLMHNNILNTPPHHISRWSDKSIQAIGSLVGLEVMDVKHDTKLYEEHKILYGSILTSAALRNIFGIRKRAVIENSFAIKLIEKLSKLSGFLLKKGISEKLSPKGHSVTVILKKS